MDPIVLFFIFGVSAGLLHSKLRLPTAIYELLSIILLLSIGLKGGAELSVQPILSLIPKMLSVIFMGCLLTVLAYQILKIFNFKLVDAASIAAHYGSVSVGTYAVVVTYLTYNQVSYEDYMSLFVVLLEIPAIIVGVVLAKGISKKTKWKELSNEILLGKSVVLLIGGLLIGWAIGPKGLQPLSALFIDPFKGILALFMLEMGLITSQQLGSLKRYGIKIILFGLGMPLLSSLFGSVLGYGLGSSIGGATVLATMFASASYIAVPAAMRITVPEANPTLSLTSSLGVTLPFNLIFGITIYYHLTQFIYKIGM